MYMKKAVLLVVGVIFTFSMIFMGVSCKTEEAAEEVTEEAEGVVEEAAEEETEETTAEEEQSSEEKALSEYKIGAVINTMAHPYYVQIVDGYKKVAEGLGVNIIIKDPDGDANKQVSMIEELIQIEEVDALCVDPCLPGSLASIVQEASELGIPLVSGAGHIPGEISFVGSDNYVGARMAGAYAGEWLRDNVTDHVPVVALIQGTKYPIPNLRMGGFIEGVKEYAPDAIIEMRDGDGSKANAMTLMEDILTVYDRVDCTFGLNDAASLGALAACEAKFGAEDMIAAGFDCDPDGIATLKDPDHPAFMVDVAQYPDLITKCMVVTAIKYLRGEEVSSRIWAPVALATRDNVDEVVSNVPEYEECEIEY